MLARILPHVLAAVPIAFALSTQACDSDRTENPEPSSSERSAFLDSADGGVDFDGGSLFESDGGAEFDAGDDDGVVALADSEIAGVLQRFNATMSEQGALALTKAASVNVAAFGAKLEAQHLAQGRALTLLLESIAVVPQDSALSAELASAGQVTLAELRAAVAPEFDRQYLRAQIAQFNQALAMIDGRLLPQAKSVELRAYLQSTSSQHRESLAEAEQVLEQLDEE